MQQAISKVYYPIVIKCNFFLCWEEHREWFWQIIAPLNSIYLDIAFANNWLLLTSLLYIKIGNKEVH